MSGRLEITVGPLLFNWPAEAVRTFYRRVADDPAVDRVYLGEVVCGKRGPLLADALAESAEALEAGGKTVVWSTLALPANRRELRASAALVEAGGPVEINDISALARASTGAPAGTPFVAGPFLNVYNEAAARELMRRGCVRLCANIELSLGAVAAIARGCPGLEVELFAYGRLPLALSGRCYHARLHGLHKDACQFVCERDPDGLAVATVEATPFLAMNGVQTLSHGVHVVDVEPARLREAGVGALRLSPHTGDMAAVSAAFRRFADGRSSPPELRAALAAAGPPGPLVNGYLHGARGLELLDA